MKIKYGSRIIFILKFEKQVYLGNGLLFITPIRTKNVYHVNMHIFCSLVIFKKLADSVINQDGRHENYKKYDLIV